MKAFGLVLLLTSATIGGGSVISVPAGGDLQAALDRAHAGDTIELEPGASYTGHFVLPLKDGASFTTVRTAGTAQVAEHGRIAPGDARHLARLVTPDVEPALQTAAGAHHWRLTSLEVTGADDGDLIDLGSGASSQDEVSKIPHDLVVDHVYVHGDPLRGRRRGIALNSASTTITASYISDIKAVGRDAQAICGWNGPGPFTITNNYLEASTENILFGGADPTIVNLVPTDVTISGNSIAKPVAWRQERWEVKNLLELKNARRVSITNNTLEYSWKAAQTGFAVLFTVRNQDGACPWCEVSDVVFEDNLVEHSGGAMQILGVDNNHPSRQTRSIAVRSNVFADIDNQKWGGGGYAFQITDGPRDVVIDRNVVIQDHGAGFIQVEGPQVHGFVFTNNVVRQNTYGVMGRDRAPGNDSLNAYFPSARFTGNTIADGDAGRYPGGNRFPSWQQICNDARAGRDRGDAFQQRMLALACDAKPIAAEWMDRRRTSDTPR